MKCTLLWIVLAFFIQTGSTWAQSDSIQVHQPDSIKTAALIIQEPTKPKTKTWPVAVTVVAILVSSYLLYNVRSR